MKKNSQIVVITSIFILIFCNLLFAKNRNEQFKNDDDLISYAMGLDWGKNLQQFNFNVNVEVYLKGFKDGLSPDRKPLLNDDEINDAKNLLRVRMQEMQNNVIQKQREKNKQVGKQFLLENAKKEGIKILKSGLQYQVIKKGTGPIPKLRDFVKCHYKGTTIDGKEFDSSYKNEKPIKFPVTGVIKGWTEALQLMNIGSKWKLFIPENLAYGDQGSKNIGPGVTLIFEIELLGIETN